MSRRRRKPGKKRTAIFRNRRNPRSRWIPFSDIFLNTYEWFYGFWHRVPKGSTLKWRGGKITGHETRHY